MQDFQKLKGPIVLLPNNFVEVIIFKPSKIWVLG